MDFLELCSQNDVEGVLVFGSYDLKKEVEFCAAHKMYYIRPTATSSEADFQSVAANPYFVGEIGPGAESEYQAGFDMGKAMAKTGKSYVILSGGGSLGNEMHRLRTVGILDALQEAYRAQFAQSTEELALVSEPVRWEKGRRLFAPATWRRRAPLPMPKGSSPPVSTQPCCLRFLLQRWRRFWMLRKWNTA